MVLLRLGSGLKYHYYTASSTLDDFAGNKLWNAAVLLRTSNLCNGPHDRTCSTALVSLLCVEETHLLPALGEDTSLAWCCCAYREMRQ